LGALLAKAMFSKSIPVVLLGDPDALASMEVAGTIIMTDKELALKICGTKIPLLPLQVNDISLW
jgi:hypothetical protein